MMDYKKLGIMLLIMGFFLVGCSSGMDDEIIASRSSGSDELWGPAMEVHENRFVIRDSDLPPNEDLVTVFFSEETEFFIKDFEKSWDNLTAAGELGDPEVIEITAVDLFERIEGLSLYEQVQIGIFHVVGNHEENEFFAHTIAQIINAAG